MNRIERQQHASKPKSTMRTCIVFTQVFKMEEEKERQIAFLHDVLLIRDDHGFIKTNWFHKKTRSSTRKIR